VSLNEWLREHAELAREAARPEVTTNPTGQRFTSLEDMSPQQWQVVNLQAGARAPGARRTSLFNTKANPESCPTPDGGGFTGHGAESCPEAPSNLGAYPYRDLSGQWCDGKTDEPLSPDAQARWGIK
jgi:hypothetical protein